MKFLLPLIFLFSFSLFAGDRSSAYNIICKPLAFESDRNKCISQIKPFNYFDDQGLRLCASFSFISTKLDCLNLIADKVYDSYEMDSCVNATFDSEKLKCLKDNGTAYRKTCLPRIEVESQLSAALNDLRAKNYGTVEKRLIYLHAKFSDQCL